MNVSVSTTDRTAAPLPRESSLLAFDFEAWRVGVMRWLAVTSALVVAYWVSWLADRDIVAADHTSQYLAFEQSFPLADAWLLTALIMAAVRLWRRAPSALAWVFVAGGAGMYLCGMDVLYDLQHGIYTKGGAGMTELAINVITAASSVGIVVFGWHFRYALLGVRPDRR
jgi:hypothetical protein